MLRKCDKELKRWSTADDFKVMGVDAAAKNKFRADAALYADRAAELSEQMDNLFEWVGRCLLSRLNDRQDQLASALADLWYSMGQLCRGGPKDGVFQPINWAMDAPQGAPGVPTRLAHLWHADGDFVGKKTLAKLISAGTGGREKKRFESGSGSDNDSSSHGHKERERLERNVRPDTTKTQQQSVDWLRKEKKTSATFPIKVCRSVLYGEECPADDPNECKEFHACFHCAFEPDVAAKNCFHNPLKCTNGRPPAAKKGKGNH